MGPLVEEGQDKFDVRGAQRVTDIMHRILRSMWSEDDGVLSFEWVLLVTLLTIGIVSGVAAARDAIIDELGDVSQAMLALDQSYTIDFPLLVEVHTTTASSASNSGFEDSARYRDCPRNTAPGGQGDFEDREGGPTP